LRRKALNLKDVATHATLGLHSDVSPGRFSSVERARGWGGHPVRNRPDNAPKWPNGVKAPLTISRLTGRVEKGTPSMDGSRHPGFAEATMSFAPAQVVLPDPILAEGARFRVRSLCLAPGEATSLQSHLHRSEHWVVVEGTAEVTVGVRSRLVGEGEAIHIPLGQPHRLENPGRLPVTLIAVETGCYLGEDDVVRHE
jgi:mannose-6-phosphate isomerase-like protein (cupin superfamily)